MRTKSITAAAVAGLAAVLLVGVANATYAGKNGRIAIVQRGGGGFQIWTVLPDGSDPQQLTTQGFNATPSFSTGSRSRTSATGARAGSTRSGR